ncbi:MAG: hypothetical protein OQJ99_06055 [Rhodospirillales bacterium]|nr:hypothetical protein [Rhodospirillales bacterium]MCW8862978.1 hypothetical protein [Rhodospirillales bacterium]MCW8951582.1 hypothetical protein [Rhodospirillales bacterium]MCW9003099.1 hypothetical protein [Rhodospirillales bacterium]MCW9040599.1 hypothetical protein [Rhodospirillales bacterium]
MLTVIMFVAISGVITLTVALIYGIASGGGTPPFTPAPQWIIGVTLTIAWFYYFKKKTGFLPGGRPIDNPTTMNTEKPAESEAEDKQS